MQRHEGLFTSSSLGPSIPDTLDPRGGLQLTFKGWSRRPPEGVEEFLKFCLHSDMGLSRARILCSHFNMGVPATGLSSVLILIWSFLGC